MNDSGEERLREGTRGAGREGMPADLGKLLTVVSGDVHLLVDPFIRS